MATNVPEVRPGAGDAPQGLFRRAFTLNFGTARLATKIGLASVGVLALAGVVQSWALDHTHTQTARAVAIGLPLAIAAATAWTVSGLAVPYRTRAFVDALRRIAAADWSVALPPAPDVDLQIIRDTFQAMANSLNEMTTRLRYIDAQRRRLFADLAHELATPISSVLGIADSLADPKQFGGHREKLVGYLVSESARLERLAMDVRDLAMLDDPDTRIDRKPTDIAALATSAVDRAQARVGTRITVEASTESSFAFVDPLRIDQVFTNLLNNAARYTPDGGRILVTVVPDAELVCIVVEDSGRGVPVEMLSRLAERLFRVETARDRNSGGHGLGLSIVAAVVQRHDGSLAFSQAKLGGLCVTVKLPRIEHTGSQAHDA